MRAAAAVAALALSACAPLGERPHTEAQWLACQGLGFAIDPVSGCSAVINDRNAAPELRAQALVLRGQARADMNQHGRAIADFGRALRLNPELVDALIARGRVHVTRGAYVDGLRDLDAALALAPGNSYALEQRRLAFEARVDGYAAQIAALNERLIQTPSDPELLNNRCWFRALQGEDLDMALADCNAALRARPDYAAALDSRGFVNLKRGAFAAALADYEAALAIEPGNGHYLYGRGVARYALGQTAEGEADIAAAERAQPGVTALYRGYAL